MPTCGTRELENRVRFAISEGWADLFAPVLSPFDVIGSLKPDVARATGLPACDARALRHPRFQRVAAAAPDGREGAVRRRLDRDLDDQLRGRRLLEGLDPDRDTLANVTRSAAASPRRGPWPAVSSTSSRPARPPGRPTGTSHRVIRDGVMALPAFVPGCGPFRHRKGNWTVDPDALAPGERVAAASLYSALITAECLGLVSASGPTVVEGPVARNPLILAALRQLTGRPVEASRNITGTSAGRGAAGARPRRRRRGARSGDGSDPGLVGLEAYAAAWRAAAMEG